MSDDIKVFSTLERRRSRIDLEIEYGADIAEATRVLIEAASGVDGVHADYHPRRVTHIGSRPAKVRGRWRDVGRIAKKSGLPEVSGC